MKNLGTCNNEIYSLITTSKGCYAGTSHGDLFFVNNQKLHVIDNFHSYLLSMTIDKNESLYLGLASGDFWNYQLQTKKKTLLAHVDGEIVSISNTDNDYYFVTSNRKIYHFAHKQIKEIYFHTEQIYTIYYYNNFIYFGDVLGNVYQLNNDGKAKKIGFLDKAIFDIKFTNNYLYFLTGDGNIYYLDLN